MAEVTVVIPNYNGMAYLENCIKSLLAQKFGDYDIVVVDNGSEDGSADIAALGHPRIRVIRLSRNFGFSRAANEGIKASKTPYILLLNNDTEVEGEFVWEMLSAIRQDENIFSVSAKMIQLKDRTKIDGAGDLYCALGWGFARGKGKRVSLYEKDSEVFSACAGAAIYRKRILNEIGYFDEFHFAYLEDLDIGYRAKIMGYRNVYHKDAVVYHVGSGFSGSRYNEFKVRLSSRNNVYVIYKNMPVVQIILNLPLLFAGFLVKIIFFT